MSRALSAMLLPVSLAVAQNPVVLGEMPLMASDFKPYPSYQGGLAVKGTVTVGRAHVGTQVLFFDLSGVDMECATEFGHTGEVDACGIHIHTGFSCSEAGPHFFSNAMTKDPWKSVIYSTVRGKAVERNVYVTTGLTLSDLANRAVVVHDAFGVRVACARLSPLSETGTATAQQFSVYPGYTGGFHVQGNVEIAQEGVGTHASQSLRFNLTGIDQACETTMDYAMTPNACGIHIQDGRTCADASRIGGDLYDAGNVLWNPWASIQYVGAAGSATGVSTPVVTGVAINGVIGKTLVVYDATGTKIACAMILAKKNATVAGISSLAGSGPSPRWWALAASAALAAAKF